MNPRIKKYLVYPAIAIIVIYFLLTVATTYNFDTHTILSCDYSQKEFQIPDVLTKSKIIFEKPVYYEVHEYKNFGYTCVKAFDQPEHVLNTLWMTRTTSNSMRAPAQIEVPAGTEFTIYKMLTATCASIGCMDSGGLQHSLILKDDKGKLYVLDPVSYFDSTKWSFDSGLFLYKAGYYQNGKRIGDLSTIILDKKTWQ